MAMFRHSQHLIKVMDRLLNIDWPWLNIEVFTVLNKYLLDCCGEKGLIILELSHKEFAF